MMSPGTGQTALVNGCSIYYEVHGSGEPLVLLHGFQASGAVWRPVIDAFASGYRLIVPDLRGHGRSNNPANEFTHRQAALDIFALLDRLGIERFNAMGISSGGMVLLHMAAGRPERVEAMILIGATFKYHEQAREIQRKLTVESMSEEDWRKAREFHKLGDDQIRSLRAQFHAFKDVDDDMNFTPESLARITARTFVVHGDRDPFFPVSIPVEMYTSVPRAWLWIIPNGGHIPVVEHRAEFNRLASAFLRGRLGANPGHNGGHAMTQIPNWDEYYLNICRAVGARSKDPNTKIGCVIAGPAHEIRSTGYNSFPRGIRDDVPERLERPAKYLWIEHAERNAILNAARCGTPLEGCTIYVEIMPCMDCGRAIVQAGIREVVISAARMEQYSSEYYDEHFGMVEVLFREAKVNVRRV